MKTTKMSRSVFLPMAIAFGLLSVSVTFGGGTVQWVWQSQPQYAVIWALLGVAFLVVHFTLRPANPAADRRTSSR